MELPGGGAGISPFPRAESGRFMDSPVVWHVFSSRESHRGIHRRDEKGTQVDPLSPVADALALAPLLTGRKYDMAIESGRKILEMDRGNGLARWLVTTAYERKGDISKTIDMQEEYAVLYGESTESAAQRFTRLRRAYESLG